MKTIVIFFVFVLACGCLFAQVPEGFKYQAIARDGTGNLYVNKNVTFRISIIQGTVTGATVYNETHVKTTNNFGLVDLEIGKGSSPSGNFSAINWGADVFFVKVEMDPNGGTSFQPMGTSQLWSVPYALRAKTVEMEGDRDTLNEIQALSIQGSQISLSRGGGTVQLPTLAGGPFSSNGGVTSNTPLTDNFVFGSSSLNDLPGTADNSRFFFNKSKGAFRAGNVSNTDWDDANLGLYSAALGFGNLVSGTYSFAAGSSSKATGYSTIAIGTQLNVTGSQALSVGSQNDATATGAVSIGSQNKATAGNTIAIGIQTNASASNSTAIGYQTIASANGATALGGQTTASGSNSTALGHQTKAFSYAETVVGCSNMAYTPESTSEWKANDRLFVVGNGLGNGTYGDAFVVLKNGKTGILTNAPTQTLDVNGTARIRGMTTGVQEGAVYRTSDGTLITGTSDIRLKENILPLQNSLDAISRLQGVTFTWKNDPAQKSSIGFIAQDFEKVLPELVFTNPADGYKGINYGEVTAVLTEAVKELKARVDQLASANDELKAENGKLKQENKDIQSRIAKMETLMGIKAKK